MSRYVDVAIPFTKVGNKQFLSDLDIARTPEFGDFVERFKHCFERSYKLQGWFFYMPEERADDEGK